MRKILFSTLFLIIIGLTVVALSYFVFDVVGCDSTDQTFGIATQFVKSVFEIFAILGLFDAMLFVGEYMLEK